MNKNLIYVFSLLAVCFICLSSCHREQEHVSVRVKRILNGETVSSELSVPPAETQHVLSLLAWERSGAFSLLYISRDASAADITELYSRQGKEGRASIRMESASDSEKASLLHDYDAQHMWEGVRSFPVADLDSVENFLVWVGYSAETNSWHLCAKLRRRLPNGTLGNFACIYRNRAWVESPDSFPQVAFPDLSTPSPLQMTAAE